MPGLSDFHHLHLHSEYSLLDGAIQPSELADLLVESGMRGCAITDHGSLFGAIEFYDALSRRELHPIIGMEAYISPTPVSERDGGGRGPRYNHITLLAMDETGYRNLCRISSTGYLDGFYYKPRIDRDILARYCGGIAIGSACLKGELAERILAGDESGAREAVGFYHDLVGRDRFFIELMDHGLEDEKAVLPGLARLAADTGALPVATNDAHYLRKEHAYAHEVLLCIQTGRNIDDPGRMRFGTSEFYVKTPQEMERLFDWIPGAVPNTARIADMCSFRFEKGEIQLPAFPIPEGSTMASLLRESAVSGLAGRLGRDLDQAESERLESELRVIEDMGFPGYFLIVSELRRWASSQGIAMGPGRGSAAGSLVSYATGITDVNPLVHGLNFSRFLNPARREMPDIDLDFCVERRQEVIEHIVAMYGRGNVSQIVTFNRMKAKSVIRDVVRALGLPVDLGDQLSRMASKVTDPNATLEEIMAEVPQIAQSAASDETVSKIIDLCKVLENHARNTSVHAAGVIIAPGDLLDFVPLYRTKNEIMTQYEMKSLDRAGLLKLDVLGLRTVTVLQKAERMVREAGIDLSVGSIPLDDPGTLALLRSGETTGVFQLEGSGMRDALRKIGVNRFEDVTAAVAIFRPGSMDMIDTYAKNKQGMEAGNGFRISYLHPELEEVLSETYGVMIYQEQVMAIANRLGGMTMSEADVFRKAISKKNAAIMGQQRERFVSGATGRGIPKAVAVGIFDQIEKFAEYGFNKSHAVSYALLAFQTAYMKAHYPAPFLAALLSSWIGNIDQLSIVAEDCRRMGVPLLPPSVNEGESAFRVTPGGSITYALSAVRNVGEGPAAEIVRVRGEDGPFLDLFDFASRVDPALVNRRVYDSLAGAGAFDCLEPSRARVMAGIEAAMDYGARVRQAREAGQMSLFGGGPEPDAGVVPELPEAPVMSARARLNLEKSLLGFYLSGHPMDDFSEDIEAFTDFEPGQPMPAGGGRIRTAGVVTSVKEIPSRSGPIAFVTVEGREGACEVIAFSDILQKHRQAFEPGSFLLLEGEVSERRDESRLSVSAVAPMEDARRLLRAGIVLRFSTAGGNPDLHCRVAELLRGSPGGGAVRMEIVQSTGRIVAAESRSIRVDPSDSLLAGLRDLLGADAVRMAPGVRSLS
ncbi:MAG: DNA polymerase III subunit alpha [Candidatus Fermentibacter sp.]|nr:DNA polymerase III subunit alpha [Candidatus Fermentibacter sp.]